jgi:AAA domain
LHKYNSKQAKLKILLVAPSNDATDILVEKLSPYFPTSEMIRIVAFTRSMDQLSPLAKPYVRENLPANQMLSEIASMQIVVTTVNMAARLFCTGQGLKKGCFDVLCVDEACHATEPEVIGAAATLMKFTGKNTGQVVLAGDRTYSSKGKGRHKFHFLMTLLIPFFPQPIN